VEGNGAIWSDMAHRILEVFLTSPLTFSHVPHVVTSTLGVVSTISGHLPPWSYFCADDIVAMRSQ
jgi:hypothetical protein